eukprot:CAMPEP_0170231244 /NCGR_PEP_ID=MMETSP0116_2-20130129/15355_1 /TAXON_ID=400756 /ORGANISM="Durinskia baltica, Strain CSIRO CS-38" /LENGTH=35 /DNA_ID= /DNA_START= /DNA_END= /DNA_ORIENTATION=
MVQIARGDPMWVFIVVVHMVAVVVHENGVHRGHLP